MPRLQGRSAIVTGSGFGIGRAIAIAFAREGAHVTLVDIREEGVRETASLIESEVGSGHTLALVRDLSDPAQCAPIVDAAVQRFGRLDCLVNNAANQSVADLEHETVDHWDYVHAVNVRSMMLLSQAARPHLIAQPGGSIVNLSSLVGSMPLPGRLAYNVTKTAVAGLTRAMAVELGPLGVRVNGIAPGHIMAVGEERWKQTYDARQQAVMKSSYALARVGRVEEVASVAVFLASDDASFVTGQTIYADGGMSILCPEEAVHRAAAIPPVVE
jgi:NAD(P)-dependent dehydrogenase (short-subunit alcohol dehydrogenase family)